MNELQKQNRHNNEYGWDMRNSLMKVCMDLI